MSVGLHHRCDYSCVSEMNSSSKKIIFKPNSIFVCSFSPANDNKCIETSPELLNSIKKYVMVRFCMLIRWSCQIYLLFSFSIFQRFIASHEGETWFISWKKKEKE